MDESQLSQWLSSTLIFQGLSWSQLLALTQIAQFQAFKKGELIFKQGRPATRFFVVKTGRVKVFKLSVNGREQILNIFDEGENFAEVAAIDGLEFPASATALDPTTVVFFPRTTFLALLHQYPDIAIHILSSFARHTRHLVQVIEDLSFKDVPQRLASHLLNLKNNETVTPLTHQANIVKLDLSKSQLAAALGTIPATLSRSFYRLSTDGIIAVKGMQIEILDHDRLLAMSQLSQSQASSD